MVPSLSATSGLIKSFSFISCKSYLFLWSMLLDCSSPISYTSLILAHTTTSQSFCFYFGSCYLILVLIIFIIIILSFILKLVNNEKNFYAENAWLLNFLFAFVYFLSNLCLYLVFWIFFSIDCERLKGGNKTKGKWKLMHWMVLFVGGD